MVVFGTRPEAIKLFPVVTALHAMPSIQVKICVTGQHRHILDQVLRVAGIVPDFDLDLMTHDQSLDRLTAALITGLGTVFDSELPDRIIVQGDTTTAMTGALAAHYRKIPVAHVEAGLRSGNAHHPWPEEVNRRIIATIADLHFCPTQTARDALIREGIALQTVHLTGNTVIDALMSTRDKVRTQPSLVAQMDNLAVRFAGKRIVAVTTHRRENFEALTMIADAIAGIAAHPDIAVIFPVHPNPAVVAAMTDRLSGLANVAMIAPLDYPNIVRLLDLATLVLTDSGGIQEEAPSFGKPVLIMRETTERPEGVVAGTAKLVGTDPARILHETFTLLDDEDAYHSMARAHNPYGDGRAAERIAEIIAGDHKSVD